MGEGQGRGPARHDLQPHGLDCTLEGRGADRASNEEQGHD